MIVDFEGHQIYLYSGGEPHQPNAPAVCFIHGAAMDHTIWILFSRYWAKAGYNVVSIDLPGHGQSTGQPLPSIEQQADFVAALLQQIDIKDELHLVGHSMGSLVALECAARLPGTQSLTLLGTAYPMLVGQPLLDAAHANDHSSVDMISLFGHSFGSQIGGNPVAGIHAQNLGERLMEQAGESVMYSDLNACHTYTGAEQAAAAINCSVGLVIGEQDQMTSPRGAAAMASLFSSARVITLEDCGHMMFSEKPEETHRALVELITTPGKKSNGGSS